MATALILNEYDFCIIGAGNVGVQLFRYFLHNGFNGILVCRHAARSNALIEEFGPARIVSTIDEVEATFGWILLCTQDSLIGEAAKQLETSGRVYTQSIIAHTSGSVPSSVLAPLASRCRATGSLHPIQSFHSPNPGAVALEGIGCGVEGSDDFIEAAAGLAIRLDWRTVVVSSERKALYHAACVFAGNFPVALGEIARSIMAQAAKSPVAVSHLLPMIKSVSERLRFVPAAEAITGPASRGDKDTISSHYNALSELDPDAAKLYAAFTSKILHLVDSDPSVAAEIERIFGGEIN